MSEKAKTTVAVGKKKSATARVTIKKGKGIIRINSIPLGQWGSPYERDIITGPFAAVSDTLKDLDVLVTTSGGGVVSQAAAVRVAIARGLVNRTKDAEIRKILLAYDNKIIAGDARQRETYKPGRSAPRAKRQKSYR